MYMEFYSLVIWLAVNNVIVSLYVSFFSFDLCNSMMDLISINAQFFCFGLKHFATYSSK